MDGQFGGGFIKFVSFLFKLWLGCGDFGAILCFYFVVLQGGVRGTLESVIDCILGSICIFYGMLDFYYEDFYFVSRNFPLLHFQFVTIFLHLYYYYLSGFFNIYT